ncbi:MAG: TlpA family protein disulfide reductase [Pyrinomonadaceae bacterium]|nr:TlpA family protein disulfide reductase [Pyrinomonadaceae bacterium]
MKLLQNKYLIIVAVIIGLILPFGCFLVFKSLKEANAYLAEASAYNGTSFPESQLYNIIDESDFSDEIKKGKVLVIYVLTGCQACKKESKLISDNFSKLDSEIKILGITIEKKSDIEDFINQYGIKFPILYDKEVTLHEKLKIKYFPTNFLLENGKITKTWFGTPIDKNDLFQKLEVIDK